MVQNGPWTLGLHCSLWMVPLFTGTIINQVLGRQFGLNFVKRDEGLPIFPFWHAHHVVWTPLAALCQTCHTAPCITVSLYLPPTQPNVSHIFSVPYSQLEVDWSIDPRCSPVIECTSTPFAKSLRSALPLWVKYTFLPLQYWHCFSQWMLVDVT